MFFLAAIIIVAAIFSVCFSWQVGRTLLNTAQNEQRDATAAIARELQSRMIERMAADISLINGVKALIEAHPGISLEEYRAYARSIKRSHPAIRNIAAAPNLVVRFVYPYEENKAVIGLDYRKAPEEQRDAVFTTIKENRVIVAGPVTLIQGGEALILRAPVFPESESGKTELWGIVAAPIDMQTIYEQLGIPTLQKDYEIAIRGKDGRGAEGEIFFGETSLFNEVTGSLQYPITLGQGSWVFAILPKGGWVKSSPYQGTVIASGVLLFSLLSLLGWFLWRTYQDKQLARQSRVRILKEKEEFLEILSHEIRSPLQGVLAAQKFLLKQDIAKSLKPIVLSASQAGDYILDLINDYLDLQRADSNRLADNSSALQIRPLLDEVISIVTVGEREGSVPVRLEVAEDVPAWLILDRKKIQQILINLIGNALKYTFEGEVRVTVQVRPADAGLELELAVEDTGIGIDADELDILFDRFVRTRRGENSSGSGLGLAITRMLVKALGGTISVQSEVAKGTRFTVVLPTSEDVHEASVEGFFPSKEMQSNIKYGRLKLMTVVVADDVLVNRLLLKAMLSPIVKEVIMVEDGAKVLQAVHQQRVDAIVTDINMPGVDGLEVARRIKRDPKTNSIRVVGLTGEDLEGHRPEVVSQDLDSLLTKPIDLEPLLVALVEDKNSDIAAVAN